MNEPTEPTEPINRQEERDGDRMEQYAQELNAAEDDEDRKVEAKKHTLWGDIGLVDYNRETRKLECRIGDCESKMETAKTNLTS